MNGNGRIVGLGCTNYPQSSLGGVHNPEPRTARGARRAEGRNEAQTKAAKVAYAQRRSNKPRVRGATAGQIRGETFTMRQAA